MNRLQRVFLVCGLVGLVFLCLCPPWDYYVTVKVPLTDAEMRDLRAGRLSGQIADLGYRETSQSRHDHVWVLAPPGSGPRNGIAFSRLALEAGAVVGITAIAVLLAGDRRLAAWITEKTKPSN